MPNPPLTADQTVARIMGRTTDVDECLVYQGYVDKAGYGVTSSKLAGERLVHRVVYVLTVGPIPDGMELDHTCRNRGCVNVAHLELVTRTENNNRTKGLPSRRGLNVAERELAKTHCPRGHEYTPENTYKNSKGYRWCRACRRERYAERSAA